MHKKIIIIIFIVVFTSKLVGIYFTENVLALNKNYIYVVTRYYLNVIAQYVF